MNDALFEELMHAHGQDVLHFVRFYSKNSAEAEDLTQEIFIRAYTHRHTLGSVSNAKSWLLRVAVNVCRDYFRWKRRRPVEYMDQIPDVNTAPSAEESAVQNMTQSRVFHWVTLAPSKYKEVLLLHYFEELSIGEVAFALGVSESAVKSRLHRGREWIRKQEVDSDEARA